MKITIASGIQLCDNPRAYKDARALSSAGHEVNVLGAVYTETGRQRIESLVSNKSFTYKPVIDLTHGESSQISSLASRLRRRIAREFRKFGIESRYQLGLATTELLTACLENESDLYVLHLPQAMWAGRTITDHGFDIAVDIEDWYSRDHRPEDHSHPHRLLDDLEREMLQKARYVSTTSDALGGALAEEYGCPQPIVVYNSFPFDEDTAVEADERRDWNLPSICWFSQTIGPGRGLEQLFQALTNLNVIAEVHLRGDMRKGFESSLDELIPDALKPHVYIHPQVPQQELVPRLSQHDIGLCGDLPYCDSRNLTITNKAFEYLRAGLKVIASDTTGHRELAELAHGQVTIYRDEDIDDMTDKLSLMMGQIEPASGASRTPPYNHLNQQLAWETMQNRLISTVSSLSS